MRVAYADPPYFGSCRLYQHNHGDDGRCWDDETTHAALVHRLCEDFPDGWALSAHSISLRMVLAHCPHDVRIAIWVKPYTVFRPNFSPLYGWEPVLFRGGRRDRGDSWRGRDWVSAMPPVFANDSSSEIKGRKPEGFCWWVFNDLLGLDADDTLVDLFPGSGVVTRTWQQFQRQRPLEFR